MVKKNMPSGNAAEALVQVRDLVKVFKDFWMRPKAKAVNSISFDVNKGEIVGLLGPNGSGKSTTVKILLGLLDSSAGIVKLFGESPRDVAAKNRIGYLPEESYLYKYLTAAETLDFYGSLFKIPVAERERRVAELLKMVGLQHAKDRRVGEFSKGMMRRIGLAQAMINDPELLILDEPTSGLDPMGNREVKELLLHQKKRGKSVLITSHLLSDIEDICDRVIILYGGQIRAEGHVDELLSVGDSTVLKSNHPLSGKETTKLLGLLRENFKEEKFAVERDRISLEDFFISVIEKARQEKVETAGVVSGGSIAAYLDEDVDLGRVVESKLDSKLGVEVPKAEIQVPPTVETEADIDEKIDDLTAEETLAEETDMLQGAGEEMAQAERKLEELFK